MRFPRPFLYYITDRVALDRPLVTFLIEAVAAGIDFIQLREKDLSTAELLGLARSVPEAASRLVVNDRVDVAVAAGAGGVHLGGQSVPPAAVRRIVPAGFLVGVSCHSVSEVIEAEGAGADYALLGPVFPTASKLKYGSPIGLDVISSAAGRVRIPVLALGGVTLERARSCVEAGAAGVAAISLFQQAPSVSERAQKLREVLAFG
jgi:thiamine-phosphate pyrophosphorylase